MPFFIYLYISLFIHSEAITGRKGIHAKAFLWQSEEEIDTPIHRVVKR